MNFLKKHWGSLVAGALGILVVLAAREALTVYQEHKVMKQILINLQPQVQALQKQLGDGK